MRVVLLVGLLAALSGGLIAPASSTAEGWVIEFGPYAGYYDFDRLTAFEDRALFGARATVHLHRWVKMDAEFDEVYTRRSRSGNRARQITLAMHARVEPDHWRIGPTAFVGLAFVGLDDAEDPDAYGEAFDLGLGGHVRLTDRWRLRAEWMLRRQEYRVFRRDDEGDLVSDADTNTLWGRGLRVGVAYVF